MHGFFGIRKKDSYFMRCMRIAVERVAAAGLMALEKGSQILLAMRWAVDAGVSAVNKPAS